MDEPLSDLDAQLRLQTRTELERLHRDLGTTMIYVTHDQGEAMTLGGRIAVMQRGAIVQIGRPLDLCRQPINRFVGTFLGSSPMSLIEEPRDARLCRSACGRKMSTSQRRLPTDGTTRASSSSSRWEAKRW